ncbi:MAG: hypothetical protein WCG86_04125 [Actinomycetota bacterium]
MSRYRSIAISIASVAVGAAAITLAGFGLASAAPHQATLVGTPLGRETVSVNGKAQKLNAVSLTMSAYPDSSFTNQPHSGNAHPDWVSYSNDRLEVPAHTVVHMTIKNYDGGGNLNNDFFRNVIGTVGGTAKFDGVTAKSWNPTPGDITTSVANIGHTFTLRGTIGNGPRLFVSVPLPANQTLTDSSYGQPVVVSFSFITGAAGVYNWNCEFPCGGSRLGQFGEAMSTFGYMSGTLTVK